MAGKLLFFKFQNLTNKKNPVNRNGWQIKKSKKAREVHQ